MMSYDFDFFFQRRVTNINFKKKTIELCFRQTICPFLLNRVLCCHYHKRRTQLKSLPVDRYLSFFHHFKQCSLCFCWRTVYFVNQYDIAENRTWFKLKTALTRIENRGPDNITWHQIRSKLNTRKINRNGFAKQFRCQC